MAFVALSECRRLDTGVLDDSEYAAHLDPPLTTAAVPAEEMGN